MSLLLKKVIMKNWKVKFSSSTVTFVLDGKFAAIEKMVDKSEAIYITDENVYALHQAKFKGKKTIVFPAGEEHKHQATVDFIIEALLNFGATRQSVLIGVGGGFSYDTLGFTHYAKEDLTLIGSLPNFNIYTPFDSKSLVSKISLAKTISSSIIYFLLSITPIYILPHIVD